jgi:hypothetical protein
VGPGCFFQSVTLITGRQVSNRQHVLAVLLLMDQQPLMIDKV